MELYTLSPYGGGKPPPVAGRGSSDCQRIGLKEGSGNYVFLLNFTWPEGCFGHIEGLYFWSAIFEPGTFDIIGDLDHVEFGYY